MVRRSVVLLALAFAPALLAAQEARTHTVVYGNTLWGIARDYLGNPYFWPRVFEANRDVLNDPDVIQVGQVLRIPGAPASVTAMEVTSEAPAAQQPAEAPMQPSPTPAQAAPPQERAHTMFYRQLRPTLEGGLQFGSSLHEVSVDEFYSAPWLIGELDEPEYLGWVAARAGGGGVAIQVGTAFQFDELHLNWPGAPPAVGTRMQVFTPGDVVPGLGRVMHPSGILEITRTGQGGVEVVVAEQYGIIEEGQFVRAAPAFERRLASEQRPHAGPDATSIVGMAAPHALQSLGDHVFVALTSAQGATVGDHYDVIYEGHVQGTVKIVGAGAVASTARIIEVLSPVFRVGAELVASQDSH